MTVSASDRAIGENGRENVREVAQAVPTPVLAADMALMWQMPWLATMWWWNLALDAARFQNAHHWVHHWHHWHHGWHQPDDQLVIPDPIENEDEILFA